VTNTARMSLLPAAAGALLLGGCSLGSTKIDDKKAEKLAIDGTRAGALMPKSASCPTGVRAEKGKTFACTLTFVGGAKAKVTMHILSDKGRIRFGPKDLEMRE
jgi:hypothetical protein